MARPRLAADFQGRAGAPARAGARRIPGGAASVGPELSASDLLLRARRARTAPARAKYATRGLANPRVDRDTLAMLLRQLYLAHLEARRFEDARQVAEQMVAVRVLPDVARQDAARAALALGDVEGAVLHLRAAGRESPPSRRAFHLFTLGTTLHLAGRPREAVPALRRAVRWSTTTRPLLAAALALAARAAGLPHRDLGELLADLESSASGGGYGELLRGELRLLLGDRAGARALLLGFAERVSGGRVALAVGLRAEVRRARQLLRAIDRARDPV